MYIVLSNHSFFQHHHQFLMTSPAKGTHSTTWPLHTDTKSMHTSTTTSFIYLKLYSINSSVQRKFYVDIDNLIHCHEPLKEHETYTTCQVPSKLKSITIQFETKISSMEAACEIVCYQWFMAMVKLAKSSSRSFSSLMVADTFLVCVAKKPFAYHVKCKWHNWNCHRIQFHALWQLISSCKHAYMRVKHY